jgi:hypothetical protein
VKIIPYSPEAERWFASLERNREGFSDVREDEQYKRHSWLYLDLDCGKYTVPLVHGQDEAVILSLQYAMSLPGMWHRLGCTSMTILQGLEVKNRALIMGDIALALRALTGTSLLPERFEGRMKVFNPYNRMTVLLCRRLEEIDKTVPVVSPAVPKRWLDENALDEYEVVGIDDPERGRGVGLAIADDKTDVSQFDVSGSIANLRDVG